VNYRLARPALLIALALAGSVASALEIKPGIGAGLLYTDNAALTSDNEDNDLVAVGYLGADISENEGPFRSSVKSSLIYQHYTEDTFSDQYYLNLNALAGWEMIRDRLDWKAENFFTQRPVNSLNANTPDNRQDTNVFTFGPIATFPVSGRQQIRLRPQFRTFYYEDTNTDNRQYSLFADWSYQFKPTLSVGVDGGATKVAYDDDDRNPDYTSSTLHGFVAGTQAASEYRVNLGTTHIQRDDFENQDGFTGDLTGLYHLTGRSSARAYLATELRDSSTGLLKSSTNPDDGDFSNEQTSGDVLRNKIVRLTFRRVDSTFNTDIWGEYRDLDYKEAPNDRDVKEVGASADYRIAPLMVTGAYGRYNRTKETDSGRRDKTYIIGGNVAYNLSRNLRTKFDLQYRNRDSNRSRQDFKEFSAFISLVYGFRDLTRPTRYSGN